MGQGLLTIGGTDVTDYVDANRTVIEFQANRLNGIAQIALRDEAGTLVNTVRERAEVVVKDDAVRIFGGHIGTLTRTLDAGALVYVAKAQSYDWLLDTRVIESGLRDGATRYDDDDVAWIISHGASDFGLEGVTHVAQLRTDYLPTIDYTGMTMREALSHLATYTTGAEFWVDAGTDGGTKYLHWTNPKSAQLVSNPDFENGSTNWSLDGAASIGANSGPGGTGDGALDVTGTGSGRHESTQTVSSIIAGRRYVVWVDLLSNTASGAVMRLDWQNVSSVSQRIDVIDNGATTGSWVRDKQILVAPATATKVVVMLGVANNSTAVSTLDNVNIVGEDAAWGVSTSPDGTTTKHMWRWSQPSDSASPVNRVLVIGDGITGWREHAASISYYGERYEATLEDDRVTTTDGIDSRAAWLFSKYAFPSLSGSYATDATGLQAGTWQIIEVEPFGIEAIEWIATIKARFEGNDEMEYEVTYGAPEDDIGSIMVAVGSMFGDQEPAIGRSDPVIPGTDANPPAVPTGITVTSDTLSTAGEGVVRLLVSVTQPADTDLYGTRVEYTRDLVDEETPDWTTAGEAFIPAASASVSIEGLAGNTAYFIRLYAEDVSGNRSSYVYPTEYPFTTAGDDSPPGTPAIIAVTPGINVLGARWTSAATPDLRFYQLRWSDDGGATWLDTVNVYATAYVITGLDNQTEYTVEVRSVDVSGNTEAAYFVTGTASTDVVDLVGHPFANDDTVEFDTLTGGSGLSELTTYYVISATADTFQLSTSQGGGAADFTTDITAPSRIRYSPTRAADFSLDDDAGWSVSGTGTPGQVQAGDLATDSVTANAIAAGSVTSETMTGSTITVKESGSYARGFRVVDSSDDELGIWDWNGLTIRDPADPDNRFIRLESGGLNLYTDGQTAIAAITPDGINAQRVNFGEAVGGHNVVPNASFELSTLTGAPSSLTHTDTTHWNATYRTSSVNVTEGTALTVTTW